ncbi:GNAT family N-acetyltransferase [Bacillus carboniphilus]|uniref:GNAT family N-acetyltransferase n=1 Tax=Bacillus carboniphilus TaxID=86663 RepID=A0ABY9K0J4_9BACI|nr:GNAT family N-acetyltransferase [Bacillus carboniphilus]WLR44357.1 GNAT family N-acetyltransferase [Bacillus carboniphilus]
MVHHENWNQTFEKVFHHREIGSCNQRVYTIKNRDDFKSEEPMIDEEYEVVIITSELIDKNPNTPFLRNTINEYWTSIEQFLEKGIGFCVVYKKQIVSVCFSGFVFNDIQ